MNQQTLLILEKEFSLELNNLASSFNCTILYLALAEVDSDMKNYADLGRCYHLSFRDLHKGGCQCSQAMRSRHAHICRENYLSPSVLYGMAL